MKPCTHRRLGKFAPLADTWKCKACGALFPQSALVIKPEAPVSRSSPKRVRVSG